MNKKDISNREFLSWMNKAYKSYIEESTKLNGYAPFLFAVSQDKKVNQLTLPAMGNAGRVILRNKVKQALASVPLRCYFVASQVVFTDGVTRLPSKKLFIVGYTSKKRLSWTIPLIYDMPNLKAKFVRKGREKIYDCWDLWGEPSKTGNDVDEGID